MNLAKYDHPSEAETDQGPTTPLRLHNGLGEALPPTWRIRLRAIALRWLKGAATTGFFRDAANRDAAKTDSDLAILADRDEFRKLFD